MAKTPRASAKKAAGHTAPPLDIMLPQFAAPLLAWYHQNRRVLPFREDPTPYHVWVSEIMLQQTQVKTALPYYHRFMQALPNVAALAACDEDTLHKLWEGLGYYNRARNLQKAARLVMEQHGGTLPGSYEALLALPGIGEYTAGAIASIAFGLPQVAVDGNVLRVAARLAACHADIAEVPTRAAFAEAMRGVQPKDCPGDFNQAVMELGALVCTPSSPDCGGCPLAGLCAAYREGLTGVLPVKAAAKAKTEVPMCVLLVRRGNTVLLHRRQAGGLLAGLWEPLCLEGSHSKTQAQSAAGKLLPGIVLGAALPKARHVFTHRVWQLYGWQATLPPNAPLPAGTYVFATANQLRRQYALPGAFSAYLSLMLGEE